MKKLAISISIIFLCISCAQEQSSIKDLENVRVYPTDIQREMEVQFVRSQVSGKTNAALIGEVGSIAVDEKGRVFWGISVATNYVFNPIVVI